MANKKPLKIGSEGIAAEFSAADTVAPANGGTGLSSADLAGNSAKVLAVNATEDGFDLVAAGGGGGGGGIARTISAVSTNTSAGATANTDYVYLASNTITITLPTAVGNSNRYTIKNVGAGVITIATTSGQTIDGAANAEIHFTNNSVDLISTGSNWKII